MAENWNVVPRVTQFDEADITRLTELRKKYAPAYEQRRGTADPDSVRAQGGGGRPSRNIRRSIRASTKRPQEIVLKDYYHLGIAVDTEAGLIVPVMRDADRKSLLELSQELDDLAGKARHRKVSAEELKGGTFTVSNQGGIGGVN